MNRLSAIFNPPAFLTPAQLRGRNAKDPRLILLGLGILLYGLVGSPTPESVSLAILLCGVLLVAAMPLGVRVPPLAPGYGMPLYYDFGLLFIYYGLSLPLAAGLLAGHSHVAIIRDIIWLGMMTCPLFYPFILCRGKTDLRLLTVLLACAGWFFGGRIILANWVPAVEMLGNDIMLYLPNSPLVIFATLWLGGTGLHRLTYAGRISETAIGVCLVGLALVPAAAMMSVLQRASFAVIVTGILIFLTSIALRAPGRLWRPLGLLCVMTALLGTELAMTWDHLLAKTREVGLNMRLVEAQAVLELAGENLITAVFGYGWGMNYDSPVYSGIPVGYTHNLLTYICLKAGLTGLLLVLGYVGGLVIRSLGFLWRQPVLGYAILMPLCVNIVLYANHKSFGFAMLLVVLAQAGFSCRDEDDNRVKS